MWTDTDALSFIRHITRNAFNVGWNLHLGGGVLDNGESTSDLDILAMPRYQVEKHEMDAFIDWLVDVQSMEVLERYPLPFRECVKLRMRDERVVEMIFVRHNQPRPIMQKRLLPFR